MKKTKRNKGKKREVWKKEKYGDKKQTPSGGQATSSSERPGVSGPDARLAEAMRKWVADAEAQFQFVQESSSAMFKHIHFTNLLSGNKGAN